MGFSNGYDAGYDDAKAELTPKIRALEAQLASAGGAGSSMSYAPGPGGGSAPGGTQVQVEPFDQFGFYVFQFSADGPVAVPMTFTLDGINDIILAGPGISRFNAANGDSLIASYKGQTIDMLANYISNVDDDGKIVLGASSASFHMDVLDVFEYDNTTPITFTLTIGGQSKSLDIIFTLA